MKDSRELLNVIETINDNGPLSPETAFFSIDVEAMYPSIPQNLGLSSAKKALDKRTVRKPSTKNLIQCLKICLTENHFEFNKEYYTQVQGTSIGPKMAPGYACLAMGMMEENFLQLAGKQHLL